MRIHSLLARKAEKLLTFLQANGTTEPAEKEEDILDVMQKVHRLFPQYMIVTCQALSSGMHYVSDNCQHIIGYSKHELYLRSKPESFFANIHEADIEDVHFCFDQLARIIEDEAPEHLYKLRFELHYRFRHADGHYVYLSDQKASFIYKGEPVHYSMMRDITQTAVFKGVRMEVSREADGSLQKIFDFVPQHARRALTRRETELVGLMRRGLTTKEIGNTLQISPYTVRNIRQKMFERYAVNNAIELLNLV